MKKERKDYCGPFWMPKFMRIWLSDKFNASCKIHDMDYGSKKFTRKEADVRFLEHMTRQAKDSKWWKFVAKGYYYAVRLGGKLSWDRAKKGDSE